MSGHWAIADMRFALEDVSMDVIQAHKLERRIMHYELNDREWAAIKLASIRIWLRAYESAYYFYLVYIN